MHKSRTRRQQIAIRSFTYGVMTLMGLFGLLVSLALAMGFRFDFNGGKLTQVALIQFSSFPAGATVRVDDRTLSSKTPTRSNVESGKSVISVSKKGYRQWQKTASLTPSQVLWLDYIRLVPNSIRTDSIKEFTAIKEMSDSPDKHWILIRNSDDERKVTNCPSSVTCDKTYSEYYKSAFIFVLADISDPTNVRFSDIKIDPEQITIPDSDESEKFSIVEWDSGSRYVLVKHQVGEAVEYLQIDRQNPTATQNLTRGFGMSIDDPHFSGTSGQTFFALTDKNIRKFDFSNKTVSAPLVTSVESYEVMENKLVFVASETKDGKSIQTIGFYDDGSTKNFKTYDSVQKTRAVLTRYRDVDYLAIARGETVAIYTDPFSDNSQPSPAYLNSPGGTDWLSVSPSGRFVLAGHSNKVVDFDLDTKVNYSFEVDELNGVPIWIDDFHIIDQSSGHIGIVEFDGSNKEDIVSANGSAVLSTDEKYMFSIGDVVGGVSLQRSKLYVD